MPITIDALKKIFPTTGDAILASFIDPINKTCAKYGITSEPRLAAFLSQIGHESANLTAVRENLNYSAHALRSVFGKYFQTDFIANQYARQPQKIANRVYANRMGNGNEQSGDGWKYRGRGAIQLTGKNNYTAFARDMGMTLEQAVAYLETPEGAIMSAGWFWNNNKLNEIADTKDVVLLTKRINGGTNGLQHRKELYEKSLDVLYKL